MDPIAILQNRIEQLEAKLGVASNQQGGDSRVQAGDSVAANLMNAHTAMASGTAGHEKVTAAMAQATELNNYTSPDVMQHMQQRQMQMHEVAAAEPAIRHHCHCMHRCKQAAPALESDVIAQVPQMQATVDHMKADTISIKSDADAQNHLHSPRPNIQEHGSSHMPTGMQMQGNPNTMNVNPVYHATVQNNTPFQGNPSAIQGNPPAQVDPNAIQGNPNLIRGNPNPPNVKHGNPNVALNEAQRYRNSMFGGHNVASAMYGNPDVSSAMYGNPNIMHGSRNVAPNEMHGNSHVVHGHTHHVPNVINDNPNMVPGNVDEMAGHANIPYAHTGHAHPNTMPHTQMVHGNHDGRAAHDNMTMPVHVANQNAQPASPRTHPEVSQGIQQLAETCGATAGSASEQLASVTQKVEQAELRKYQRRNGLD